jgi:CheY-like chemotaxis protein
MAQTNVNGRIALVVEDEPGIAEVCKRTLSAEGLQVDIATNGKVALGMLRKQNYDLCLCDIRTPEMNGIELYQHWEEEFPETVSKVIFTTGDVLSSGIKEFLEKTQRPYLAKPFTPHELRTVVRAALVDSAVQGVARLGV